MANKQLYYEDVEVGTEITTLPKIATTRMLVQWAGASGDFNPLHYDEDFAKASGVGDDVVKQIQNILGWPATKEQIQEAMKFVPDELVQRITASGKPEEVKAKVREYAEHGCTCPILYPLGDPYLMTEVFSDGYSR